MWGPGEAGLCALNDVVDVGDLLPALCAGFRPVRDDESLTTSDCPVSGVGEPKNRL